jgi:hypothetical protein
MKRWLLVLLVGPLLAGLAPALVPPAADDDEVRQFRRDRPLIEALVEGGLRLSAEDDPLRRADYCAGLAERFADEVRQSVEQKEAPRVEEMGAHLSALLEHGVALNLNQARGVIPPGSADEKKLQEIRGRAVAAAGLLEERLKAALGDEREPMEHTLRAVHDSRERVEKALKLPEGAAAGQR